MSINQLETHLAKPVKPYKVETPEQWAIVEDKLGTTLPNDYKEFINTYGSGIICGFLEIYNPFAATEPHTDWFYSVIGMFEEIAKGIAEFDVPLFPTQNGLFPCGRTENGGLYIVWKTGASPDLWTIGLINIDTLTITYLEYSLSEFIVKVIQGGIANEVLNYADKIDCSTGFQPFSETL